MFVKKGEEKECYLQCSRKELLDEFLSQTTDVLERIGEDANLLAYDMVIEAKDIIDSAAKAGEHARQSYDRAVHSVSVSAISRVPRASAAAFAAVLATVSAAVLNVIMPR